MYSDQHLRVSDAEREAVTGQLAEHFAAGRLDQAEFDDRVGRAMSARTRADLSGLFADLPETGAPAVPELPRGGGSTPGGGPRGPGSPIEFRLDAASGVPTYLQLVHQVEHALRLGYLKPFAAWTLAAFAIGALAGMLIRRVIPAIAATLGAYAGLAFATGLYLRQHYLTPLLTSNLNPPAAAAGRRGRSGADEVAGSGLCRGLPRVV